MNPTMSQILSEVNSTNKVWQTDELTQRLAAADPKPSGADLWLLCSRFQEQPPNARPESAGGPSDVFAAIMRAASAGSLFESAFNACPRGFHETLPEVVTDFLLDYLRPLKPKRLISLSPENPASLGLLFNSLPTLETAVGVAASETDLGQASIFSEWAPTVVGWK